MTSRIFFSSLLCLGGACLASDGYAQAKQPPALHAHGTTIVDIAQNGKEVSIAFDVSGLDVVGFERAPRNDAEHAKVSAMLNALESPDGWLAMNAEARCRRDFSGVTPHVFQAVEGHEAKRETRRGGHDEPAFIEVQYSYTCDAPDDLRAIDFHLIERFPQLRGIIVNLALPGGRRSQAVLTTPRASIPFAAPSAGG